MTDKENFSFIYLFASRPPVCLLLYLTANLFFSPSLSLSLSSFDTFFYFYLYANITATKDPGQQPFTFNVGQGQVIKAWDEGVIGMSIGEIAKIHASPDYAYGSGGFPAWGIMPNRYVFFFFLFDVLVVAAAVQ